MFRKQVKQKRVLFFISNILGNLMKSLWLGYITKKSHNCFVSRLISLPPFPTNIAMLCIRVEKIEFSLSQKRSMDLVSEYSQLLRVLKVEASRRKINLSSQMSKLKDQSSHFFLFPSSLSSFLPLPSLSLLSSFLLLSLKLVLSTVSFSLGQVTLH